MAKMRIGKDIEVMLDTSELLDVIRAYSTFPLNMPIQTRIDDLKPNREKKILQITPQEKNSSEGSRNFPSVETVIKSIESRGRPFAFTLLEEQMRFLGRYYDTKENPREYRQFYSIYREVQKLMAEKYGGRWERKTEMIDGHQIMKYTLVDEDTQISSKGLEMNQ